MRQNILIYEDKSDIAEGLCYNFRRENFRTDIAESSENELRLATDSIKVFGTGLRLTIDKYLAGLRGGEVKVISILSEGTSSR